MLDCYVHSSQETAIPIRLIETNQFPKWVSSQNQNIQNWVKSIDFCAKSASFSPLGNANGQLEQILFGINSQDDLWSIGVLPSVLPAGIFELDHDFTPQQSNLAHIAWGLGSYQFKRYRRRAGNSNAKLRIASSCDKEYIENAVQSIYLIRDLINTPTEDMGPAELAEAARNLAEEFNAKVNFIIGDDLLKKNYPAIHAVGRGSQHAPRLIDLNWGNPSHPHVALIGKGVCFDTGGLNLKPALNMRYMKKDMAGAAHVLGLARMIMAANLPIRLRVLIPAVENAISGNVIRPGDIIQTRHGLSVEVTNTDAEGRLILADALTEASRNEPDLLIDFATLTGAARVALGPDPGAFFTDDEEIATAIYQSSVAMQDPLWRLPIYRPYRCLLDSPIADICNADVESVGGGAIMAALFLREFIPENIPWVHFDIMAFNLKAQPARPLGGEAMGIRAVYHFLEQRFK